MAEVLGTLSAVLSIIQGAESLLRHTQRVGQADEDWNQFRLEVDDLKELSRTLETRTELSDVSPVRKNLAQLRTLLLALESKVTNEPTSLSQRWRWQYAKDERKEILESVERVKSLIDLQLNQHVL
jgi:hypothetical protein